MSLIERCCAMKRGKVDIVVVVGGERVFFFFFAERGGRDGRPSLLCPAP